MLKITKSLFSFFVLRNYFIELLTIITPLDLKISIIYIKVTVVILQIHKSNIFVESQQHNTTIVKNLKLLKDLSVFAENLCA